MNKKLVLTSILAIGFAMPAMPAFATGEVEQGDMCTTGVLGQSDNNSTANVEATWTANTYSENPGYYLLFSNGTITQHVTCPANSVCEGFTDRAFNDASMGIQSCTDAYGDDTFPYSAAGTSYSGMCYATGSVTCSTFNPYTGGHGTATYGNSTAGSATYKTYSDYDEVDNPDSFILDTLGACNITSLTCDTGYRQVNAGPLNSYVNQGLIWSYNTGIKYRALNGDSGSNSGNNDQGSHAGMSNGAWEVTWPDGTKVSGMASCNTTAGTNPWGDNGYEIKEGNVQPSGTFNSSSEGQYCWCHMDSYTLTGSQSATNVAASSSWVFYYDNGSASDCASYCAARCAHRVQDRREFRGALFGSLGANPVCTANTINIDWDPQNGEAHTTNQCTYDGAITLPAEPSKTGYTFGGWRLKTNN